MQVPLLRFGSIDAEGQEPRTTSSSAVALCGLRLDDEPSRPLGHDRQRAIGAGADDQSVPAQVQDDGAGPDNGLSLR